MTRIIELRAEGLRAGEIAKRLNAEGHKTAKGRWWDERAVYNWENRKSIRKCGEARAVPVSQKPKPVFIPVLVPCKTDGGFAIGYLKRKGEFTARDDVRYETRREAERQISIEAWSKKPGFCDPYGVGR
jgi:hypothetical protein